MTTASRLPGHALWSEGWPVTPDLRSDTGWRPLAHRGDIGRALCECGEMSTPLLSAAERKRWHRDVHKPAVRAGTTAATDQEAAVKAAGEKEDANDA